jgi:agmatine deiminase
VSATPESPTAPAKLGWRWPAEWEPHAATWITWPHNPDTWPGCLDGARRAFVAMTAALQGRERVCILVNDAEHEAGAREGLAAAGLDPDRGVAFHPIPTDDGWLRDCGPVWLLRGTESAVVDFPFDAWGRKYPPWDRDAAVPAVLAERLGLPRFRAGLVLEGGAVDGDGRGTILTTESCLLNPNRGPGRTREALEQLLADSLGARQVVWLGDGIAGDDTDGHVDDFARFVAPGVVVLAQESDAGDANHAPLTAARERLRGLRDADGKPVEVVALPMPPPLRAAGERLPASYANFYLANGVALVPTFEAASDERALAVLREVLAGREVVGVPCRDLVVGLGALHCVTQQQPAPAAD